MKSSIELSNDIYTYIHCLSSGMAEASREGFCIMMLRNLSLLQPGSADSTFFHSTERAMQ